MNVLQEREAPELAGRLEAIVSAATTGAIEPQRLFGEAFVQHTDHVAEIAFQSGVDPELLATLAAQALAPLLRAYAERLLPSIQRHDVGSPETPPRQPGDWAVCGARAGGA